jgi:hypothetical protein
MFANYRQTVFIYSSYDKPYYENILDFYDI